MELIFYWNDERDDYWHCGEGTLVKSGKPDKGCLQSPGTAHCGSIMHGWTKDDRVMITCCNDGTDL